MMFKRIVAAALLAVILHGCAKDADFLSRRPPDHLATMGRDLRNVPPGQSIPASGMGVDLQ
jgi:hypothetical protein